MLSTNTRSITSECTIIITTQLTHAEHKHMADYKWMYNNDNNTIDTCWAQTHGRLQVNIQW